MVSVWGRGKSWNQSSLIVKGDSIRLSGSFLYLGILIRFREEFSSKTMMMGLALRLIVGYLYMLCLLEWSHMVASKAGRDMAVITR